MKLLEGIKVVEFGTHVVIPASARVLGDWGAEVIKIESAGGDSWRTVGQRFGLPVQSDCNPMYSICNSGKRFVSLNLKSPEGKEAMLKILETADIFMTNVRWGAIERLGLDYDTLHKKFPKLIYMHFNGYGYEGPDKDRPGFDTNVFWAMAGTMHEIHEPGNRPSPIPPLGFGDTATSGSVLSGILGALIWRMKTGEGLRVTSSLLANGIWCNHNRILASQEREDGTVPPKFPKRAEDTANPFSHIYECSDGEWMAVVGGTYFPKDPVRVLRVFGLDDCAENERYTSPKLTKETAKELYYRCVESFKTKTCEEWNNILDEADIPHQRLAHSGELAKSEQAWANNYLTKVTCPNGNSYVMPNSPVTFFGLESRPTQHAGGIGSSTTEVLLECGYTQEEIQAMKDNKVAYGN